MPFFEFIQNLGHSPSYCRHTLLYLIQHSPDLNPLRKNGLIKPLRRKRSCSLDGLFIKITT